MENKNKFIVSQVIKGVGKQFLLLEYKKDLGDPLHDDLPTDIFQPGEICYVTPAPKEDEEEFNKSGLKKD